METSLLKDTAPRRAGFTLIELLAVMLLILTVLGMGVPAMFAAERKSYVNQAMNDLLRIHEKCSILQRELSSRGAPGQVTLTVNFADSSPKVTVTVPGSSGLDLAARFGVNPVNMSINSEEFVSQVTQDPSVSPTPASFSWTYDSPTGFISGNVKKELTFRALANGTAWKMNRVLKIYPQGYSEIP